MKASTINVGDIIVAGLGFACLNGGQRCLVEECRGEKYVQCRFGMHYIRGRDARDGEVIGFSKPK